MTDRTDILIAGAGLAGLCAACALGTQGHRITLVDPAPPVTGQDAPGADLRTTALLQPARDILRDAGAWDRLQPHAAELWTMRIVDAGRNPPETRDFRSLDISDEPFGWNFPNWLLRRELLARVDELPNVTQRFGQSVTSLLLREAEARVTLSDGTRLTADLVIAMDGKASALRDMAGIGHKTVDYGQTALVFAVGHQAPHENISTEIHATGGPFTLVPLPDDGAQHRSAVVWMDDRAEQTRRKALHPDDFTLEMNARSFDVMGPLDLLSDVGAWPITSIIADQMSERRLCLAAEAAHAMPPIGAQGLNTSLKDVAVLLDLCANGPVGTPEMTDAYARARKPDVLFRMTGIDLLNRMSIAGGPLLQQARAKGMTALHDIAPLRKRLMRLGMGGS